MNVGKAVLDVENWVIELRRYFHMYPELGFEEYNTARKISDVLKQLGIIHITGVAGTGIIAMIKGSEDGECVALRADMDALPLQDIKDKEYKSKHKNKMHACGHDAHMAILLGVAKILKENEKNLKGTVKLIFQPAEETDGGALPMIKSGVMNNPKVDKVLGIHVSNNLKVGQIGLKYGQIYARSSNFEIHIYGKSAHGAHPEKGVDAILISAQVITTLQNIISRELDAQESAVISIGTINGGNQENIIASKVSLKGTVRTLNKGNMNKIKHRMNEIISNISKMYNTEYSLTFKDGYIEAINSDEITKIVEDSSNFVVGKENTIVYNKASLGVEDMAYFLKEKPGCFFHVGVQIEDDIKREHHSNVFDINEEGLKYGVAMYLKALEKMGLYF